MYRVGLTLCGTVALYSTVCKLEYVLLSIHFFDSFGGYKLCYIICLYFHHYLHDPADFRTPYSPFTQRMRTLNNNCMYSRGKNE